MGLSSVMQVGLAGMSGAELTLDAVGNNLANLNTTGYKQSFPRFATQVPQARTLGHPPGGSNRGTNLVQIGGGVQFAKVAVDFTQSSLVAGSSPTDLAVEGDGFFILQNAHGERAYTRNGQFRINGQQRLVTADGDFVLGFAVDGAGNVIEGPLVRLEFSDSYAEGANGNAARLMSFTVGGDGRILGRYSDGVTRTLGKIPLARFSNPNGLIGLSGTKYIEGPNSGTAHILSAEERSRASIAAGTRELSNTDLGGNLIAMLLAENQYRANWQVVGTASELLNDLKDLRRR